MRGVEIIVGHDWQQDVRYLHDLQPHRPVDAAFALTEILDIIDIVVDGRNLTSSVCRESIFGFFADLLEGIHSLHGPAARPKAIIEFHCEPLELVLVPEGRSLLVSLYALGREHRVIGRDLPVATQAFVDAVARAIETLLSDLFRISPDFSADPFIRRMSSQLARLQRVGLPPAPAPAPSQRGGGGPRSATTSSHHGLSLIFAYDGDDGPLRSYDGAHAFDLHALLFDGRLELETVHGHTATLAESYPFLALVDLTRLARELLGGLEEPPGGSQGLGDARRRHRGPQLEAHLEPGERALRLVAGAVEASLPPATLVDLIVGLAEMVLEDLFELNPRLELDQRAADLHDEIRELRSWLRSLQREDSYLEHPERFLAARGHLQPQVGEHRPPEASFPWPLASARALYPRPSWTWYVPRIQFRGVTSTAQGLLVPTEQALFCLDWESGHPLWSHQAQGRPLSFAVAGARTLVGGRPDQLHLVETASGRLVACVGAAQSPSGADATPLQAADFPEEGLTVVVGLGGTLLGLDRDSGAVRWRHDHEPAALSGVAFCGPVLALLGVDAGLTALDPTSGERLWRVRLRGGDPLDLQVHQGRLYALLHDPRRGQLQLQAIYPFSGHTARTMRIEGNLAGPMGFHENWLVVPVERNGRIALQGLALERGGEEPVWSLGLQSAGFDRATPLLPVELDGQPHGIVRTDRAEFSCFRLQDGHLRWREHAPSEHGLIYQNLPLVRMRDCLLAASEHLELRLLEDGRLVHRFDRLVETPRFATAAGALRALLGESGGERGEDRIMALDFGHFLVEVG